MRLASVLFLFACAPTASTDGSDTGTKELGFCESLADVGLSTVEQVGGSSVSGDLVVHVITNESVNPRDPTYVAFKEYTLENVTQGGVASTGTTSGDGLVSAANLGAGEWDFAATYSRGSALCEALLTVSVVANSTTTACAVMTCPD